jgi:hypothetical protein
MEVGKFFKIANLMDCANFYVYRLEDFCFVRVTLRHFLSEAAIIHTSLPHSILSWSVVSEKHD